MSNIRFAKRRTVKTESVASRDGVFKDPAVLTPTTEAVIK